MTILYDKTNLIKPGSVISRISSNDTKGIPLEVISMKEINNFHQGLTEDIDKTLCNVLEEQYKNVLLLEEGDVIFSNLTQVAMVVEKENVGKIITSNCTLIRCKEDELDPYFLCFFLNESESLKQLIDRTASSTVRIQRVDQNMLKNFELPCIEFEEQVKIGKAYKYLRKYRALNKIKIDLINSLLKEKLNLN